MATGQTEHVASVDAKLALFPTQGWKSMFKHLGVKCKVAAGRQIEKEWKKDQLALHFMLMEAFYFARTFTHQLGLSFLGALCVGGLSFSSSEKPIIRYIVQTVSVIAHTPDSAQKKNHFVCTHALVLPCSCHCQ